MATASISDSALNSQSTVARTVLIAITATISAMRSNFSFASARRCTAMARTSTPQTLSPECKNKRTGQFWLRHTKRERVKDVEMKNPWLVLAVTSLVLRDPMLFANGGAWQTGVPGTGSASASNKGRHTDVSIENETLKIDLHPEYADVEV